MYDTDPHIYSSANIVLILTGKGALIMSSNTAVVAKLIEAAKQKSATPDAIEQFKNRVKEREQQFSRESQKQAVNNHFLARSYNL